MRKKTGKVLIKDLVVNLFVRRALDQDHAIYLAELIEGGITLPPIEVTADLAVVDGRHRIEAYELNGIKEIDVIYVDLENETDLIAAGYRANLGGPLPPSREDTEHTIMLLLDRGATKKSIGELLALPAGMARKYIAEVQSKTARAKLLKAAAAVTDGGLTVAKSAEQYGVDLEKLKQTLSGTRRKQKTGIGDLRRIISMRHRSTSTKDSVMVRSLMDKLEDGDVTERQVSEIFDHLEQLLDRSSRRLSDWRKRLNATTGKLKKSA